MQEYLYSTGSNGDEYKDVFSEINAGELDEQYLIKHADDYGRCAASHPFSVLKTAVANLLSMTLQLLHHKQNANLERHRQNILTR